MSNLYHLADLEFPVLRIRRQDPAIFYTAQLQQLSIVPIGQDAFYYDDLTMIYDSRGAAYLVTRVMPDAAPVLQTLRRVWPMFSVELELVQLRMLDIAAIKQVCLDHIAQYKMRWKPARLIAEDLAKLHSFPEVFQYFNGENGIHYGLKFVF
ncbi:hypothetical protein SAMN05444266_110195 [Chitinophaga jiangningensis]|uniref:Uncharacterized protein n=1 Tax=Chitinophaga jiangningensis TaxID=1419482 RepID=A0A1M7L8Z9_9BACT|nr:hypothetical protein [Chitinophaga jiangningensis]SHM74322.1 hypothetical protein SAMN05444266_110195 [Chitinophaga jiangningensis]